MRWEQAVSIFFGGCSTLAYMFNTYFRTEFRPVKPSAMVKHLKNTGVRYSRQSTTNIVSGLVQRTVSALLHI